MKTDDRCRAVVKKKGEQPVSDSSLLKRVAAVVRRVREKGEPVNKFVARDSGKGFER